VQHDEARVPGPSREVPEVEVNRGWEVRLDPWDADYGSEIPVETDSSQVDEAVDTTVEVHGAWKPVVPALVPSSELVVFVDGVRRLDARVLLRRVPTEVVDTLYGEPVDRLVHGAFGAYAVGTVVAAPGRASWGACEIRRVFATGAGVRLEPAADGEQVERRALAYGAAHTDDTDPDGPLRAIQGAMRAAEERVAKACAEQGALVIADGPLSFGGTSASIAASRRGRIVGFVKRLYKLYVGAEMASLPRIGVGERSPIFAIEAPEGFARWSWFVRLAAPARMDSEWAGLARLEIARGSRDTGWVEFDEARRIADESASRLPRFAPSRARDARSPQNLLPIGALEAHLRRLLGDRRLARRRIAGMLATGATA
jgi:hypothetical protein